MRKGIVLILCFMIVLSASGCSSGNVSDQFILDPEIIDTISVGVVVREEDTVLGDFFGQVYNIDIVTAKDVEVVLDLLKGVEVEALSQEQLQELLENPDVFQQNVRYIIQLQADIEFPELKGLVYVLEEEKLLFIDPKAIAGSPAYNKRIKTASYMSTEEQSDTIEQLNEMVEEAKLQLY